MEKIKLCYLPLKKKRSFLSWDESSLESSTNAGRRYLGWRNLGRNVGGKAGGGDSRSVLDGLSGGGGPSFTLSTGRLLLDPANQWK